MARKPDERAGSASKAAGPIGCGAGPLRVAMMRLNLLGASTRWKRVGSITGMKFDSSGRSSYGGGIGRRLERKMNIRSKLTLAK